MTLYEAVKTTLDYAAQGEITPNVLRDVLGGWVKEVLVAGGESNVVIAYPGVELVLSEIGGYVTARLRILGTFNQEVKVADYPGDWHTAFTRVVYAALEAMEVKA